MQMEIYKLSGMFMLIGVYFTIRYAPYCTLKSQERKTAMQLHRKKLIQERMTKEEKNKLNDYLKQTMKYSFGDFILFISIILHIAVFAHNEWYQLFPLYYLSMACMIIIVVMKNYFLPFCYQPFLAMILWNHKDTYLESLNVYHKKNSGVELNESTLKTYRTEINVYKSQESSLRFFIFYRYAINFGVILHLFLDLWFGLNGSLTIN